MPTPDSAATAAASRSWRAAVVAAGLLLLPAAARSQHRHSKAEPDLSVVPHIEALRLQSIEATTRPTGCILETIPLLKGKKSTALKAYIQQQVRWPREAGMICVEGHVYARFTVDTTGQVRDVRIVKGLHPYFDAEVVRVIMALPSFTPAKQGNKPVSMEMTVPVEFKIR